MKKSIVSVMLVVLFLVAGASCLAYGHPKDATVDFQKEQVGKVPAGFTCDRSGRGKMGNWVVFKETGNENITLAQTDMDKTGYRFPVCIYDDFSARDVDVSVRFKPLEGTVDQAGGIVWRYTDAGNYYIVRANALENNVVLYKFEKGKRTDLPLLGKGRTYGVKHDVPVNQWSTLRVVVKGDHFDIYFNDKKLFEASDKTHTRAGKVGMWTKADSHTLFDDFSFTHLKK